MFNWPSSLDSTQTSLDSTMSLCAPFLQPSLDSTWLGDRLGVQEPVPEALNHCRVRVVFLVILRLAGWRSEGWQDNRTWLCMKLSLASIIRIFVPPAGVVPTGVSRSGHRSSSRHSRRGHARWPAPRRHARTVRRRPAPSGGHSAWPG